MAQSDMNIANQGFPAFRADLNAALAALVSNSSGASAPTEPFAHQFWVDTSVNPNLLKLRNANNDSWVTIGSINQTTGVFTLDPSAAPFAVTLTGNQTIAGVKTFSSNPISSATQSTATNALTRRDFVTGLDGANVKLTGNQTIAGVKTFSSSPVVPNATTATQALAFGQVATANAGPVKTALNASGNAPIYACRAWVNFNGTGTVAIRASGNVSSIVDNGVGDYTVNFTTAMPDTNYSSSITAKGVTGTMALAAPGSTYTANVGTVRFGLAGQLAGSSFAADSDVIAVAIFR
jgi:hypothetical protein